MFKFSFNWLKKIYNKNLSLKETLNILEIQGFEVKAEQDFEDDKVITVEVKANRPDFLCHLGVCREITAYKHEQEIKIPETKINDLTIDNKNFPIDINVENSDICKRFSAIMIKNIDNSVETPKYITDALAALGVNCINPVVDIANYILYQYNQPMHTYDADKIEGNTLNITENKIDQKVTTLAESESELKNGDIIISDKNKILCVAGIIGADSSRVETTTKNLVLESAIFDEVRVRLSSRRLKISTPSSFRFERGVDAQSNYLIMLKCAELIKEICGGEIVKTTFDYCPHKFEKNIIPLRTSRTNLLLGTKLDRDTIISCLEQYYFRCTAIDEDIIEVECPSYRLDLEKEVNLIEEVARIYGYHNIEPTMPIIKSSYRKNELWENMDEIRNTLVGLGFYEIITYSFIPADTMKAFSIKEDSPLYSNVMLKNPISQAYALMRPIMSYSLADCLAYNYSRSNYDLSLFEIGKTYFKNENYDTGVMEKNTLGMIITGSRIKRGFGIPKDVKYSYYDIINYVSILMNNFGLDFSIEKNDYPFFVGGTGCDIKVDNKTVGYLGELDKKSLKIIPNAKLLKDSIFYCELYLDDLKKKDKVLRFESKYPPITRQYNFLYKKSLPAKDVIDTITASSDIVREVTVEDIYTDKNMPQDMHAVLFEVKYASANETLTSEAIELVEQKFLEKLKNEMNAVFK